MTKDAIFYNWSILSMIDTSDWEPSDFHTMHINTNSKGRPIRPRWEVTELGEMRIQ